MATNPTTASQIRFRLWMSVTFMLFMAVSLGHKICRIERHGATPEDLVSTLLYVGVVTAGLYELRVLIRHLERGSADGADRN
jgi:hypothetical protein